MEHGFPLIQTTPFPFFKVTAIDLICDLTDAQKQKLQLAGRGDIKRLIDRLEQIGTRVQFVKNDLEDVDPLFKETEPLKRGLRPWFPDDGSFFDKSLSKTLTTEQNARIATLREIERLGGHVMTESRGPNAILDVLLISLARK